MGKSSLSNRVRFQPSRGKRLQVFQRAKLPGEVLIHDEQQLFIAQLNNISAGGLFIDDLVGLSPGSKVRIVVKSDRLESAVQALGTVVRVEEEKRKGLAVEFTSISTRAREVIQHGVHESRMESALKVV